MSFIIGRGFAEVQIPIKSETGPFHFYHVDILIRFGTHIDLDNL